MLAQRDTINKFECSGGYKKLLQSTPTTALDLNLKHLRALVLIGELGSVSAAADAIGLSQPALTQGVARLERQFGTHLFDRLAQGLRPTENGAKVLSRTGRAFDRLAREIRAASRPTRPGGGRPAVARPGIRPELHLTAAQVRAVLALAEVGSLSAAAQSLGLSEPAVHRAVRELERTCNVALTERRGRSVCLTDTGRRMARGFALSVSELNVALQEVARQPARLAVGAMALSRSMLIPVTLAQLSQAAPWAQVDVVDGSYGELVEALRSGTIDVVIGALREQSEPDLRQEVLMHDRITIIGRSDHPLARRAPSLDELALYPWIVGRRTSALLERWQELFDAAGIARPRAPIQCGSVTTIRGLLVRSDFLTLLSRDQVTAEVEAGLLTPISSAMPDTLRTIGAITRRDWFPTALQEEFLTLLRQAAVRLPQGADGDRG